MIAHKSIPPTEVQLYTSSNQGETYAKVQPGQFYASADNTKITTVLGSCIAACVFDLKAGVGGLNHFMLPQDLNNPSSNGSSLPSNRFGEHAMENLIERLIQIGATPSLLQAKVFGGAKVLDISSNVGELNIQFATRYLQLKNIQILASDVGGNLPRKLVFEPITGKVHIQRLRNAYFEHVASKERRYLDRLIETEKPKRRSSRGA